MIFSVDLEIKRLDIWLKGKVDLENFTSQLLCDN